VKFGSLFSGIEAASAAWLPLGWTCAWTAEIDPFACAVLRHHYPDTLLMTEEFRSELETIPSQALDLLRAYAMRPEHPYYNFAMLRIKGLLETLEKELTRRERA
jgi:site-specific DNA-cytosine methylase